MATESGPNPAPPTQALIVDSNATSRGILVGQLREYGVTRIVQCSRVQDARARLEHTVFDYVLCDQLFLASPTTRAKPCWTTCGGHSC